MEGGLLPPLVVSQMVKPVGYSDIIIPIMVSIVFLSCINTLCVVVVIRSLIPVYLSPFLMSITLILTVALVVMIISQIMLLTLPGLVPRLCAHPVIVCGPIRGLIIF